MLVRLLRGTGLRISEVVGDRNKGISRIKVRDFFRRGSDYLLRARRFKREQGHTVPREVYDELSLELARPWTTTSG